MIPYIRQQLIVEELEQHDMLLIDDLVEIFSEFEETTISESTIRRDVKELEKNNLITHLRGGGVKLIGTSYEAPADEKMHLYKEEKEEIARLAASTIGNNDIIYIDSGTTTLNIIKYIEANNVQIVTTNTHLLLNQVNNNIKDIITLSGVVNYSLGSVSGTLTDQALSKMFFDNSYLGTTGFGTEVGINTPDFREASKKQMVQKNSSKTFVLADHSKYNKRAFCKVFELENCTIITDKEIESLNAQGIQYMYPENENVL